VNVVIVGKFGMNGLRTVSALGDDERLRTSWSTTDHRLPEGQSTVVVRPENIGGAKVTAYRVHLSRSIPDIIEYCNAC